MFPETLMRFCRSRQVLKPASTNIFAHFIEHRPESPIVSKIGLNLSVPCSVLTLANE
jgi:hypothetical protein